MCEEDRDLLEHLTIRHAATSREPASLGANTPAQFHPVGSPQTPLHHGLQHKSPGRRCVIYEGTALGGEPIMVRRDVSGG